jgi:integrase
MATTRDKGDGSVYIRGDGRWIAQVELPRGANNKRRYRRKVVANKSEGKATLRQWAKSGQAPSGTGTVAEYLHKWLTDVAPTGKANPETIRSYRKVARLWIEPYIGQIKLAKLSADDVAGMLTALERDGRSARSRKYALTVLRRALGWAERTDQIVRNPARLVDGPAISQRASDALTADEARRVLETAKGERWEALAVLALKLGLRQGELLQLRWDDIEDDTLTVRKAKSEAGERTIPLVNGTAEVLRQHRQRQEVTPLHGGYVFAWQDGRPLSRRAAITWWHKLTIEALGRRVRFHASRHTCATLLLDNGVPLDTVSAVLGHANLAITSSIYARPTADLKRRALMRLDDVLSTEGGNGRL